VVDVVQEQIQRRKMVDRTILFYLNIIKEKLSLKKEFREWDKLSDEAFLNFEKSLN